MVQTSAIGSKAPVFTLPGLGADDGRPAVGLAEDPGQVGRVEGPLVVDGQLDDAGGPEPEVAQARSTAAWRSPPTTTVTGGAPNRPSTSTSQPACSSTWWRAAMRPVTLAICAPVTKAPDPFTGSPRSSRNHPRTTSSMTATAGVITCMAAFWSQADTNQSAATATGSEPPLTNPKYRGPAVATMPPSAPATRAWKAVRLPSPSAVSGAPSAVRSASTSAGGPTGRSGRESM